MWGWRRLKETSQDVRYALRGMRRSLGIGANPAIFTLAAMAAVALPASYGPARRAAQLDPLEALRQE